MKNIVAKRAPTVPGQKGERVLTVHDRQSVRAVDVALLRRMGQSLLREVLQVRHFELSIVLVDAAEMTSLNETFLQHQGSTDVITFDYGCPAGLRGDIFICVEEAVRQARTFRTTWPAELVRYLIHGLLHLQGYGDRTPAARARLKQQEDRLLRQLARRHPFRELAP